MANNPFHCLSSAPTDRKFTERNRRNEMKALFSKLDSLVPHKKSTETKTVPDQLENATNYIKELQAKLEKLKEKREKLMEMGTCSEIKPRFLLQVEAHQVGSSMEVLLVTGSNYHFVLRQILRLLQENGAEIINVNQSMLKDRAFHKIIAQVVGEGMIPGGGEGERICETVKKFVSEFKDGQIAL